MIANVAESVPLTWETWTDLPAPSCGPGDCEPLGEGTSDAEYLCVSFIDSQIDRQTLKMCTPLKFLLQSPRQVNFYVNYLYLHLLQQG